MASAKQKSIIWFYFTVSTTYSTHVHVVDVAELHLAGLSEARASSPFIAA